MSWKEMYFPREEGGLGFKSLFENRAMHAKLWWNFRTSIGSLWATYIDNKYCKRHHPIMTKNIRASQTWRSMLKIREEAEPFIWWQVKAGNSSF